MQRIFGSPNLIEVTQLQDTLEGAGIACFIRNEISSGLMGEIPLNECTPELWVQEDHDLAEALRIKSDWLATPAKAPGRSLIPAGNAGEASHERAA